jgi:hypothetical protein
MLHISRSIWRGKEQEPKTAKAVRIIDIPEVLASELRGYVSEASIKFAGLPCFSEISTNLAQLRETSNGTGWDTRRKKSGISIKSSRRDDISFRQEWAQRVGLGFQLAHIGLQSEVKTATKKAA